MVVENWYTTRSMMVTLTNHAIARAGFTLREPLILWRFLRHFPAEYKCRPKKVLPSEHGLLAFCQIVNLALIIA